jgi:hypothetical protein
MMAVSLVAVSGCREEKAPVTILFTSDVNGKIKAFG